ncbi:MAG: adenosylcobinamide-GDP ribazoletransferase [Lachnospiraceae bacterium]|nr:adenosylcobinamide-GDP ribazoletransferase [Lachnospiraceae bacterium]
MDVIRKIMRSFAIAFGTYSKIPMPHFAWKEEDMRYSLCFFPLVGAVIGGLLMGFAWLAQRLGLGTISTCLIGSILPLLVTGGFHLDGFMDVCDARHSYGERERKLEILKDPHIGAFAVIQTLVCAAIYVSAIAELCLQTNFYVAEGRNVWMILCCGFALSRVLSGLSLFFFRPAKEQGMLAMFAGTADRTVVRGVLLLELGLLIGIVFGIDVRCGGLACLAAALSFGYYVYVSKKEFGGITGDLAGFFVVICETAMAVALAVGSRL